MLQRRALRALPSRLRAACIALAACAAGAALAQTAASAPPASAPRQPVVWDLSPLFVDDAAWEAERQALLAELPALQALRATFGRDAASMRAALDRVSAVNRRAQRLAVYANTQQSTDNRNPVHQARSSQLRAAGGRLASALAWVDNEVLALGRDTVERFIAAEPGLRVHAVRLRDVLRMGRHRLSAETESALAALQPVLGAASQTRTLLVDADIAWPLIEVDGRSERLDATGYQRLRQHPDRGVRQRVFERHFGTFAQYAGSIGSTLASRVELGVVNARLRGHPSAAAASLATHDIPETVLRTLVAEVNAGLPTLHRYFRLRQRLLKLPDLAYHDVYPDLVPAPRRWSLDDSAALTLAAVAPLGADYQAALQRALGQRTVHAYPAEGKSSGAYKTGAYGMPPLVFLNHQDDFDSLTTFAHEWGHAMHSVEADAAQPFETAGYPLFTAEVASITHELLLQGHLKALARDRQERLYHLVEALERTRATFFRQTMFAEFELALHDAAQRGEPLTGARMTQTYCGLLRKYHGADAGVMTIDPVVCHEWAFIPHFYRPFYVYQYATSLAAATHFADRLLAREPGAAATYRRVLRAGGSQYPVPLLREAGVDMASPEPYRAVVRRMEAMLDEVDALLAIPVGR